MDIIDYILLLQRRVARAGFGSVIVPPEQPFVGPVGTVQVRPTAAEREDISVFLYRLKREFDFSYKREQLLLRYESGRLTLAEITFAATHPAAA